MEDDGAARERRRIHRQWLDDLWPAGGGGNPGDQAVGDTTDCGGRGKRVQHLDKARQRAPRAGPRGRREPCDVELCLLNEELGFLDLLRLGDLPTGRDDAEAVLLGGQRSGGHDPPRQGQRVSRLPCEWLCKAGGKNTGDASEPHAAK